MLTTSLKEREFGLDLLSLECSPVSMLGIPQPGSRSLGEQYSSRAM